MKNHKTIFNLSAILLILVSISLQGDLFAQNPPDLREQYLTPPDEIAEEVLAPRHENILLNDLAPTSEYFLNTTQNRTLSPLSAFSKPYYNLGGLQFNPESNRDRDFTTGRISGLQLIESRSGDKVSVDTPENAGITNATWSPDGKKLAYFAHFENETHIYVADVNSGRSRKLTRRPVLATLNTSFEWSGDRQYIFSVLLPVNRGNEPVEPATPTTLQVKKTTDKENRLRTYPDLLKGKFEAELLKYHTTGQLVRIRVDDRRVQNIGSPTMIRNIDPSPSGEQVIVQILSEPFSYIVPVYNFGWTEEVWGLNGS